MNVVPRDTRRARPATLGLLAGLAGLVVAGPVGLVVGLAGGVLAARRAEVVLLAAPLALVITAVFTVLEEPLTEGRIPAFPHSHPIAEFAAKLAAVLLLAGLAGTLAWRGRAETPPITAKDPRVAATPVATATVTALLAAALLGALVLWQLGDHRWHWEALALAIVVVILGSVLVIAHWRPSPPGH